MPSPFYVVSGLSPLFPAPLLHRLFIRAARRAEEKRRLAEEAEEAFCKAASAESSEARSFVRALPRKMIELAVVVLVCSNKTSHSACFDFNWNNCVLFVFLRAPCVGYYGDAIFEEIVLKFYTLGHH